MVKKSLLSLAIAASVAGLTGCQISSVERHNNDVDTDPVTSGIVGEGGTAQEITQVIYNPSSTNAAGLPEIPLITDLLLQGLAGVDGDCTGESFDTCKDGTIAFPGGDAVIGSDDYNPIFSAVADLDGFSTTGAIDIAFDGPLDETTLVTTLGPTANVVLIPLNYTNDPIRGGAPENNDKPELNLENPTGTPAAIEASVISYTDAEGANNVLRIMPTTPLMPATRYLVVVTDGVKDAAGVGVKSSATFNLMASAPKAPTDPTAASLYGAIQQWVELAQGVGSGLGQQLSANNIAYATTFTTAGTTEVLGAMAAPSNVNAAVVQTAPASVRYLIETELAKAPGDQDLAALVTTLVGLGLTTEQAQGAIALASHLPQPAPRVAEFNAQVPDLSAVVGALPNISMANGTIKLPYYLSAPDATDLTGTAGRVFTEFWKADDTLGADLSSLLTAANIDASAVTPPSTNVTRHFPLAKTGLHTGETNPMGYADVPVSVFYSAAASCPSGRNPIIYQHGITTNRLAAIPFTANMLAGDSCAAVVAIDLPLHGLEPFEAVDDAILKTLYAGAAQGTDANGNTVADANDDAFIGMFRQRHFGLTQDIEDSGKPRPIAITSVADAGANDTGAKDYNGDGNNDGTAGDFYYDNAGSGSLFINIANFQNTRDNMRQAVMDLLNLNASVKFLDFDGNAGIDINQSSSVKFAGHSLGAIIGTKFVALSNAIALTATQAAPTYLNSLEASVLANPGGNMTKLLENSFAFGPAVLGGFAALGQSAELNLNQGSSLFELTMHVFQATLDSADPVNFASTLASSAAATGVLMYEIAGDGTPANLPDLAVPPAAFSANGLVPAVLLDDTDLNDVLADTAAAPLAGTTPLAAQAGLSAADASVDGEGSPIRTLVRFTEGSHSSFGIASDTVGLEMMGQVRSFFAGAGKEVTVTNGAIIKAAPAGN